MNNKQISAIEKIKLSTATYSGCTINPTYINFFFGNNGVGKTTIARAIRAYRKPAKQSPISDVEDGTITFEQGKFSNDFNILVYNQDFIDANIQQYGNLPGVFTMNEQNIEIQNQITDTKKEKDSVDATIASLATQITTKKSESNSLDSSFQNDCWENAKTLRENFPKTQEGYKQKKRFAEKVLQTGNPISHDQETLQTLYETAFDPNARIYSTFKNVSDVAVLDTIDGIELLGNPIISSSNTPFAQFIKAINATDWVRQGHQHYTETADGKCPFCQRELPYDFEKQITDCFDKQYQAYVAKLTALQTAYKSAANTLFVPLQNNSKDPYPKLDLTEYTDKLNILKGVISANIQKITSKTNEPGTPFEIEPVAPIFEEINSIVDALNEKIQRNNSVIGSKQKSQTECTRQVWELIAYKLQADIESYKTGKKNINDALKKLNEDIKKQSEQSEKLKHAISKMSSKIVNTSDTVKSMNKLLRDSGFQGFSIQENSTSPNVYSVVRPGGKPASKLSEGERNFIAFLYFYHLVHGNGNVGDAEYSIDTNGNEVLVSDGTDNRDKIVVIDDPVSSMDSSSLFIVSSLVREMISICHNNISFKDNPYKGDYIKQIFILTHNAYFHREVTVNQERHYRYVSFYLITKNDNVSSVRLCTRKNHCVPTELVNYNPVQNCYAALWAEFREVSTAIPLLNVIRRILEYYFIQICGYDGTTLQEIILKDNKDKFITVSESGSEDTTLLQIASSMLSYISSNTFGINDGLHFVDDCMDIEQCRETFEMIFRHMGQIQHYEMMMETDN